MTRRIPGTLAAVVAGTVAVAVAVPPSAAFWVDQEHVRTSFGAIDCGDPGVVDATAWGRFLTGELLGADLDPVVALDGITVSNLAPATSSTATASGTPTDLGSDAWATDFSLAVLDGVQVGAGIALPWSNSVGAYTQYGRATSAGLSVGASGAVTHAAGGLVSLEPPASATPRQATLRLSTLLDSVLAGGGLGATVAQLADVDLVLGTLGAIAELDSCDVLWDGAVEAPGDALERDYLVNDLGLEFTSSLVTDLVSGLRGTLQGLETSLNALLAPGTSVTGSTLTALTGVLSGLLDLNILGINISLAQVDSITVGVEFELDEVLDAITGALSDGVVTVDLDSGRITADLATLVGEAYGSDGLNGLAANTRVLTPPVLGDLSTRVGSLLTQFVTARLSPLLDAALDAAEVTVDIRAKLRTQALFINVVGADLRVGITGTLGAFLGSPGAPEPSVQVSATQADGLLATLLSLLGINLEQVVNGLTAALVGPIIETLVPQIGALVLGTVLASAQALVASTVTTLTGSTVPALVTALGGVLDVLRQLVDIAVNGQPDQPGSVGPPAGPAPGRWFETALYVGVVDALGAGLADLYLANASVGPNALR